MRTGVFLQVRLSSRRLPKKALLPLTGGNIAQHAMRSLKGLEADVFAILTDADSAASLAPFTSEEGFELFVGPQEDVLKRYVLAARHFQVEQVVRATGDNPLVSGAMGCAILDIHKRQKADLSHFIGLPIGTGIEVVKTEALYTLDKQAVEPFEREHMTTHLYRNREGFTVLEEECPGEFYLPEVKVSVDTPEDYALVSLIYSDLYQDKPVELGELIKWLKRNRTRLRRKEGEGEHTPVTGTVQRQWDRAS